MKKLVLSCFIALVSAISVKAQISLSLATGTPPVVPAGWSIGGTATAPGPQVQLTAPATNQAGRVWYATPQNVTSCGAFTVDFDFQIIPNAASYAIADGIAFWIVNPLAGFVGGGGLGLPTNPNGLVLVLDTYDNDGVPNDPLISLYGYPAGFTGTYTEGATANRLGVMNNQNFIADAGWHHVKLTYSGGNVKVYFNYSAVPNITGYFPITTAGYFGFSSSTGAAFSTQSVRNVYINSDNISAIVGPDVVCLGTSPTYTDSTAGGAWSSSLPGIASINASGVLTPISPGTTTIAYTYSASCIATKVVTVSASTLPAITGPSAICASMTGTFTNTTAGGTWSSSSASIATVGAGTGILTPVSAGTTTITYTLPAGCYTTAAVTINTAPPPLSILPSPASVCDNGSLTLTASGATTNNLFPPQSWETGVPTTNGTPVSLWSYNGTAASRWYQIDGTMATTPTIGSAYAGTYVANFNCRSLPAGSTATLTSPSFSMVGVNTATLTFWLYRDVSAYNTAAYNTEGVTVYVNTTPVTGGATNLGYVPRRGGGATTGPITGTSTPGASGWYQYTCTIPAIYTGTSNYIIISGNSQNGNNIYLDDIRLTATIGPPTWSPNTWLFNDPGFATAYSGTPLNPVYMHPTGITTPTPITYSVTMTNGLCSSTGNTTVTMNPNPAAITGTTLICIGSSTTLSSSTPGGSWSSITTSVATVNPVTGVVTSTGIGTTTISYAFGGCATSVVVSVVASPGVIGGPNIVCQGSTITLTNSVSGGSWSSAYPLIGSVDAATGVVTGLTLGTTTISYGIGTCYATLVVSVNQVPTPITGSLGVCVGATTALSSSPPGGFWFSFHPPIATVNIFSGVVTGVSAGTALISYVLAGCTRLATVNVVSTPGPIVGTLTTCAGSTTTLTHGTPGGTWSCACPTIATVGSSSGIVAGISGGTCTITYTVSAGCFTTAVVTVSAIATPPSGTLTLCAGTTTTLTHPTASGTWSCACPGIATVGLISGVVSGTAAGTCVITYTLPSGCLAVATVTVNANPAPITGIGDICQGATTTFSDATTGGTWSSFNLAVATIGTGSGTATGLGVGTTTITYRLSTGCYSTTIMTVNANPTAITGTGTVCVTSTTALACTPAGGGWTSSNGAVATISGTGVVTGISAGTTIIDYTTLTGCFSSRVITVNATPAPIGGPTGLCVGGNTTLTNATPGGSWFSVTPSVAPMMSPGFVGGSTAGTSLISYTVAGCASTVVVTVNALPGTIGGALSVCVAGTTTLTATPGGGSWSSPSGIITIGSLSGVVTGVSSPAAPANTATVTYSLGTGCTTTAVVTVNAPPTNITGIMALCEGSSTTLTGTPAGGTWLSGATGTASIVSGSGVWTAGTTTGTAVISYIMGSGCQRTTTVTANPLPALITGGTTICVNATTTLNSSPAGGTWTSSGTATVVPTTGVVTGNSAGTAGITYTISTGCYRTAVVLVNGLPGAYTGAMQVCVGATSPLTGSPAGGSWLSSTPAIGTIGSGSGVLGGVTAGTTEITYTLVTGCARTEVATVNALPTAITGTLSVCVGQTTTLNSTPAGGTWSSPSGNISINGTTGEVTGNSAGTAVVSYTNSNGCRVTATVTVYGLPGTITGAAAVCLNSTTTLNCLPSGGTWASSNPAVATVTTSGGVITGLSSPAVPTNTTTITYTLGTGCTRTTTVTVNPLPTPITGALATCVGSTTTLNSTPAGGAWAVNPASIATINVAGVLTGNNAGTTVVSYTLPSTLCRVTDIVTVYALPSNITGTTTVCQGLTTILSTSTSGGTWTSSNMAVATVNSTGGVYGVVSGSTSPATATITYSLGTGCYKTTTVTVNPLPSVITGGMQICINTTTNLISALGGGSWSSAASGIASVNATTGTVTGLSAGNAPISYILSTTGCYRVAEVTVNALPSAIGGPDAVCLNETITLTNTGGGTWSSADATVSIASPAVGDVRGDGVGTATITYTIGTGCVRTKIITVNPLPPAILGINNLCIGNSSYLLSGVGGSWSSSNTGVATIDATGLATTITPGVTTISYTYLATGCVSTVGYTVNALPATITGSDAFCNFDSTTYLSSPGVNWTSSDTNILTIGLTTGKAIGKVAGPTVDIIATFPTTGCSISKSVYLIVAPFPISGPDNVCLSSCITLTNAIGGGVWSSSAPAVAGATSATSTTASVCGATVGTTIVTYILSTGCYSMQDVTVNPIPSGVSGSLQVCEGLTTALSNSTGSGTWSSSDTAVALIDTFSGIATGVSGGMADSTTIITYALGTGCNAQVVLTVHPLPAVITGNPQVCEGLTTTLASATPGGAWSSADPIVAVVDAGTGIVTGISALSPGVGGLGITSITYNLPTGCIRSQPVTVNPLPSSISGSSDVCVGSITVLTNPTSGGSWYSSDATLATVDASGVVTGVAPGSVVISYQLPTGCIATWPMTVNDNPAGITGSLQVCAGFATNLISSPSGGYWSQDPPSMIYGTINHVTGVVSGIMAGNIPVTYRLPSGCITTATVTVITLPAVITGNPQVCVGLTTTMSNPIPGGTWSISNPAIATVDAAGVVSGLVAGTTVVTYAVGTGCFNVHTITVNPLPAPISPSGSLLQVCEGSTITLNSAPAPGAWISGNTSVAIADPSTGVITGMSPGTAPITYRLGITGCQRVVALTVNPTPGAILGNPHICMGSTVTYTNDTTGGFWFSSNPPVATIDSVTGTAVPVSLGTTWITYKLPVTGCKALKQVTVQPLPVVYNVTGGGSYCNGGNGVNIGLDSSQAGVSYVLYHGPSVSGYLPGTGFSLNFGLLTSAGIYTVQATNAISGCKQDMAGSATVTIIPLVTPVVTIATTPSDSLCPGEVVTLSPTTTTGGLTPSYLWKINGVSVSTATTYSFIPADGDLATLTMTSNVNCLALSTATASKTLTVLPNAAPEASVLVSPNDTVCEFTPVTFTGSGMYGGSAPAWTWMADGSVIGTGASIVYTPNDGEVITVRMASNYRCRTKNSDTSEGVVMSVDKLLLPHVTIYPTPGLMVEKGHPVTLLAVVTDGGANPTYQWKLNGHPVPGATNDTYISIFNDYDSISCMIVSSGVCNNIGTSDWVFISVYDLGSGSVTALPTDIRLVPNPNRGTFSIKGTMGNGSEEINAEVTNMLGQVVYRGSLKPTQGKLDAQVQLDNTLANGMYILTLRSEAGQKVFHFVMEQ